MDCVLPAGFGLSFRRVSECWTMATDGAALVENRAGITFGVHGIPRMLWWISSRRVRALAVYAGCRSDAAESRILQGGDIRSVRVLVPDPQGLDQNFHDVTLVDMGDVPESSVSIPELSSLRQLWPPAVLSHMVWLQPELEGMRVEAKQRFRQTQKFNLDLAQLWRCPVS